MVKPEILLAKSNKMMSVGMHDYQFLCFNIAIPTSVYKFNLWHMCNEGYGT